MAEDNTEQNPFTRPGFIIGAVVVAALIIVAIVLTVLNLNRGNNDAPPTNDGPAPTVTEPTAASPQPTGAADAASVCGLDGVELTGSVTVAPEAQWQYQDVYAYPVSPTAGPGETAAEGYRFCFQHTPEGALLAAANMSITSFDLAARDAWLDYVVSEGSYRESLLADTGSAGGPSDLRAAIAGFRVLEYAGESARVDIALRGSSSGQSVNMSIVVELAWSEGDWKLNGSVPEPARIAQIPDFSGYTTWTEG